MKYKIINQLYPERIKKKYIYIRQWSAFFKTNEWEFVTMIKSLSNTLF